ncbi:MAG: 4-hydroxythreonine-4-phosphate dehydrogenase PdxA [Chthoniobacteraceae bacterium]|nr:4-hydroxythreonine-4-phosphate dehydrogenase PdxA [Chthoniobacteraceae bacterium]
METLGTIGITLGDPAGIGPEIIRAALASGELDPRFRYRVLGDPGHTVPGQPTPESARAAVAALEEAARLAMAGEIDAVVTGPIHKAHSQAAGFAFPGQTEFFAARAGVDNFAMLLTGGKITVALVTIHVPLADVPRLVTANEIERVGSLLAEFLTLRLGSARPARIAVAGLNPHAGESGAMGREEIDTIAPAVARLAAQWRGRAEFTGPVSPDTLFFRAAGGEFDGELCMYHDQGLIPLKLQGFDEGVNVTLGLPFVRTSPDHGTAFEIAGRGLARPASMLAALRLAGELAAARKRSVG